MAECDDSVAVHVCVCGTAELQCVQEEVELWDEFAQLIFMCADIYTFYMYDVHARRKYFICAGTCFSGKRCSSLASISKHTLLHMNCSQSAASCQEMFFLQIVSVRGSTHNSYLLEGVKACLIMVHTVHPAHETLTLPFARAHTQSQGCFSKGAL